MSIELLAPGGSYDSVIAALNAGADAVYTGGNLFGARANAQNLTLDELYSAIDYAHLFGKKIYLTINTLIKEKEIEEQLFNYLLPLYEYGLDAVIVQDMGVLLFIKENFPGLHIHASTQMTISGKLTVKELEKLGVTRIVTPRELSINEIKMIHESSEMEIESFVHGALCYCYSGQCFMSSYIGGRSGNRGQCAQPCRMEYDIIKNGETLNSGNNKYVLSPKDICTLRILPDIIEAGVYSLKIEGRMKKPEYVAGVVSIYRKYIDKYLEGKERYDVDDKDIKLLADLFNRNGFSESYYYKHNDSDMISLKKPVFRTENTEFVKFLKEKYVSLRKKYPLDITVVIEKNTPIELSTRINGEKIVFQGERPLIAENRPITEDVVLKQLSKLGNTNFEIHNMDIRLSDGVFVQIGYLNQLRREFIEEVKKFILSKDRRKKVEQRKFTKVRYYNDSIRINVLVSDLKQLNPVLKNNYVKRIYIEEYALRENDISKLIKKVHEENKEIFFAMPYMFRETDKKILHKKFGNDLLKFDGFLIRNIEQYYYLDKNGLENNYVFDYNVYTYNSIAKDYYLSEEIVPTIPLELNYRELKDRGCEKEEFIAYGYMPVMISAGCGLKTFKQCDRKNTTYEIIDRLNNKFATKCICNYCYNIMYNCKPLSLLGYGAEIKSLNPGSIRLNYTFETESQVRDSLEQYIDVFIHNHKITDNTDSTRGHFKRGVL